MRAILAWLAVQLRGKSWGMARSADLALAHHLADLAAEIAQRHRSAGPLAARVKDDGSPVTDADHEVEYTLRSRIRQEYPDDEFLGEESGGSETARRRESGRARRAHPPRARLDRRRSCACNPSREA